VDGDSAERGCQYKVPSKGVAPAAALCSNRRDSGQQNICSAWSVKCCCCWTALADAGQ
jgi:hypothetical protein